MRKSKKSSASQRNSKRRQFPRVSLSHRESRVMMSELEYLKTGDVARRLGVNKSTVHRLIKNGGLTPLFFTPRGHPRFAHAVVEDLALRLTAPAFSSPRSLEAARERARRIQKRGKR